MDIMTEYFEWMYQTIGGKGYRKLLTKLNDIEFKPIMSLDKNRIYDGVNLRREYAKIASVPNIYMDKIMSKDSCTVLELMIGFSMRIENDIMHDSDYGDRTIIWFWEMVKSLGLYEMTDTNYDEEKIVNVINIFMNREYQSNGKGGLFTVINSDNDMRTVEIWDQMCYYCDNLL